MNLFLFMHCPDQQEIPSLRRRPTLEGWRKNPDFAGFFSWYRHPFMWISQCELQTRLKDGLLRKKAGPGVFILIWHNARCKFSVERRIKFARKAQWEWGNLEHIWKKGPVVSSASEGENGSYAGGTRLFRRDAGFWTVYLFDKEAVFADGESLWVFLNKY